MLHSRSEILHSTKKEGGRSICPDTEKCLRYIKREHQIAAWNVQYDFSVYEKLHKSVGKSMDSFWKHRGYVEMSVIGKGHLLFTF